LPRLLGLSYQDFYDPDDEKRADNYALAWGLVYYLRKYAPEDPMRGYGTILDRYVDLLWETRDPKAATEQAFEGVDMAEFREDFCEFWDSSNRRGKAKRNRLFEGYGLK
jgi:hypothetical protein